MNRHSNHHCSSVAETINRQVGPRSPLFCSSPRPVADSRTVLACDPAQRAINRQVGPKSPLYCRSCDLELEPSFECSPADEAVNRIVGPRSSLYCR